jgi:hypothetical protein
MGNLEGSEPNNIIIKVTNDSPDVTIVRHLK